MATKTMADNKGIDGVQLNKAIPATAKPLPTEKQVPDAVKKAAAAALRKKAAKKK